MAAPAGHEISRMATNSQSSAKSGGSSKSFSSWGSRKRPRDSLEKTRERARELRPTQLAPVRNFSVQSGSAQQLGRGEGLVVVEDDSDSEKSPLSIPRSSVSCSVVCERYPKGRASVLVFVLNMIVSYAFGAAITGILNVFHREKNRKLTAAEYDLFDFIHLLLQYCISRMFYPIAGFIADVYIGRCQMIKISLVLLGLGYVMLVAAFTVGGQSGINTGLYKEKTKIWLDVIRAVAFLLVSAGGGAFEATSIPFGVDQLQGASSAEISSYFYFFYFSRNLGMVWGIFIYNLVLYGSLKMNSREINNYLSDISENPQVNELYGVFQPLVTLIILTVGIILMVCLHHWFFKNTLWENPVRLIARVLCYAATVKRHLPVRNRSFRYGEERKKRIELAKITFDGKFPDEKVEDVKAFCSIFLLLLSLIPTLFSINAFNTILSYETNSTLTKLHPQKFLQLDLYPSLYWGVNSILILLILPVVNFLVIPCFPKLTIRARIGIGLLLYLVGNIAVVAIHAVPLAASGEHSTVSDAQLGSLLIPMVVFALAEILTTVSALEFIYAQSPESMKGLLTGLFYLILGLTSILSSGVYYAYSHTLEDRRLAPFHGVFTLIQAVGIVFYVMVAVLHKNRLRPDGESSSRHQQRLMIEHQLQVSMIANRDVSPCSVKPRGTSGHTFH